MLSETLFFQKIIFEKLCFSRTKQLDRIPIFMSRLGVALSLSFHFQKGKKRKVRTFLS
jgi:hypothetical protein